MLSKGIAHLSEQDRKKALSLLKKQREFMCCANCGSINLAFPQTRINAFIGTGALPSEYYCSECGYKGIPLLFNDISAYERFYTLRREKYLRGEDVLLADRLLSERFGEASVRKPYVAAFMSLIIPGLGQAYNGEKKKAQQIFLLFLALSLVVPWTGFFLGIMGFVSLSLAGVIMLAVYALIDAYIVAKTKN